MLGKVVRDFRKARGMKQQTLAERAHIRQSEVSEIENGTRTNLTTDLLTRLAVALDVPVEQLLTAALGQEGAVAPADLEAEWAANRALLAALDQIWMHLTYEDREAVDAMIRAVLARYEPDQPP